MGLANVVRSAVATANTVTADLQDDVTHEAWVGQDGYGAPSYPTAISRQALVEMEPNRGDAGAVRNQQGEVFAVKAKVTFLGPITENGAAGREEPIDKRDRITLPDGSTGPILQVSGLIDPSTDAPYMYEVWLGY